MRMRTRCSPGPNRGLPGALPRRSERSPWRRPRTGSGLRATAAKGTASARCRQGPRPALGRAQGPRIARPVPGTGRPCGRPRSARSSYRVVGRDTTGHSRGYDVEDDRGRHWRVKTSDEAQSEIVASRVLWAIGYHQPALHYLKQWRMSGRPRGLRRTRPLPPGFGSQERRRLGMGKDNPFHGTRALQGLIVVNLILNNWDFGRGPEPHLRDERRRWPHRALCRSGLGRIPGEIAMADWEPQQHRGLRDAGTREAGRGRLRRVRLQVAAPPDGEEHHDRRRCLDMPAAHAPERQPMARRIPGRGLFARA